MNPNLNPRPSTSGNVRNWRQRIDEALSELKVAPPGGATRAPRSEADQGAPSA
jgi:hypothetical protein